MNGGIMGAWHISPAAQKAAHKQVIVVTTHELHLLVEACDIAATIVPENEKFKGIQRKMRNLFNFLSEVL